MSETYPKTVLLTSDELAERWSCSPRTLANDRSAGVGPAYVKLGKHVRYRLADVEAYEDARLVTTLGAAA